MSERKPISEKFLKENGFTGRLGTFKLEIENAVFHSVEIRVEVIAKNIMSATSIKVKGTGGCATLPIDYEDQLKKLIEALKGI